MIKRVSYILLLYSFSLTISLVYINSYWYNLMHSKQRAIMIDWHKYILCTLNCVIWVLFFRQFCEYLLSHAHAISNAINCIPQTYVTILSCILLQYTQVRALSIYKVSYYCSFYLNHNLVLGRWKDDWQLFLSFFAIASLDTYIHAHNYTNDN